MSCIWVTYESHMSHISHIQMYESHESYMIHIWFTYESHTSHIWVTMTILYMIHYDSAHWVIVSHWLYYTWLYDSSWLMTLLLYSEHENECEYAPVKCPNSSLCPPVIKKVIYYSITICYNMSILSSFSIYPNIWKHVNMSDVHIIDSSMLVVIHVYFVSM